MTVHTSEEGFSLVEVLVAIGVFAVISATFYSALFSGVRGSGTARSTVRVSEEARLGFNRMVRDTREAASFVSVSADSYRIQTDFDRDDSFESPNENGDYEDLTFTYDDASDEIRMTTPTLPDGEVLMEGVNRIPGRDVFTFASNLLEYDAAPGDGVTTCLELDAAPSPVVGNGNNICDAGELPYLASVRYVFSVTVDDRTTEFFTQAELRNKR